MRAKHAYIILAMLVFASLVWVTNFTVVGYFLKRNYSYSNYNGTYRHNEHRLKGISYSGRDDGFKSFLKENPRSNDRQLYRTFWLDPWRFWEWHEWYYHFDRFTLPYISEKNIKKNRTAEGLTTQDETQHY